LISFHVVLKLRKDWWAGLVLAGPTKGMGKYLSLLLYIQDQWRVGKVCLLSVTTSRQRVRGRAKLWLA
jgi:hypothetical protein